MRNIVKFQCQPKFMFLTHSEDKQTEFGAVVVVLSLSHV